MRTCRILDTTPVKTLLHPGRKGDGDALLKRIQIRGGELHLSERLILFCRVGSKIEKYDNEK
jgi:hypothetical protein